MAKRLIRGRRWLWLGAALFLGLVIARAPAALVGALLPAGAVTLAEPSGTIWNGSAEMQLRQAPLGLLSWRWLPGALASGELGVSVDLQGEGLDASGIVHVGPGQLVLAEGRGQLDAQALQRLLGAYDLGANGSLRLDGVQVTRADDGYRSATGTVHWEGGTLAYRMQGRRYEASLPPMRAPLAVEGRTLTLVARPLQPVGAAGTAPLLRLALRPDGWFVAGASRAFIELAGQPWQGTTSASDIVLEVEEKLF
jgi:general secretion pathway protein N